MVQPICPDDQQLSDFVSGRLAATDHDRVDGHLVDCATCQTVVETLDETTDTLLDGLRGAAPQPPPTAPELQQLIRLAKGIRHDSQSAASPVDTDTTASIPPPGTTIGNYELVELIGSGGMGRVFRSVHRRMKREVAVKVLSPELLQSTAARGRFQREVEAAAQLRHPHIVAAYDADEADGQVFLVMEYVHGSNLAEVVKRDGALDTQTALQYILQAAQGLQHAHAAGVVHRDIKPANLILDANGTVKVLDLGLARTEWLLDNPDSTNLTTSRAMMGTAAFMAPEQAANPRAADQRADIYGLGCTFFYVLTGRRPYRGTTAMEVLFAHREQPVPSVAEHQADCPAEVDRFVQAMMAKQPDDRPASMQEVIKNLQSLAITDPPRSPARVAAADDDVRHKIGLIAGLSIAALIVLSLVMWKSLNDDRVVDAPPGTGRVANGGGEVVPAVPPEHVGNPTVNGPPRDQPATVVEPPLTPKIAMMRVEPGQFLMGSSSADRQAAANEQPQHQVTITQPFLLGKFEVTQAEWRKVMAENPSAFQPGKQTSRSKMLASAGIESTAQHPIDSIRWLDAIRFCNRLSERHGLKPFYQLDGSTVSVSGGDGFRLPTEAEWEYACRANTKSRWSFGDDVGQLDNFAWHGGNSGNVTHAVGQKQPNAFGLHDMHGNVPEWCWDRYDPLYYKESPLFDPHGSSRGDGGRVFRGGGWSDQPLQTRSATRRPMRITYVAFIHVMGLRVARNAP